MRKIGVIILLFLSLSISGLVQFAGHLCKETGFHANSSSCEVEHHSLKVKKRSCCEESGSETTTSTQEKNCCTDAYFVAFSPQYGQIKSIKVPEQIIYNFYQIFVLNIDLVVNTSLENKSNKTKYIKFETGRICLLETRKLVI